MTEEKSTGGEIVRGLPMFATSEPEALASEKRELAELESVSLTRRWKGYFSKTGPGWMQSALTLGSGSAIASLYLGAHYQYRLLWVQPLAMVVGIIMLMAASHQTLSTGIRPFEAVRRFVHPGLAWAWAIAALLSTFIWHLPQYAVAAGVTEDMISAVTGWEPSGISQNFLLLGIGVIILILSTVITWNYGSGRRGIKLYERMLKILVVMIVISFFIVMVRSAFAGQIEWVKLFRGFLPLYIPTDPAGVTKVMAAFSAAVGINMTFLFGYSQLARGWGKEHRGLARFDLITGMLIPYALVTSLIVISAGCTIYGTGFAPSDISPANAGVLIGATGIGPFFGRFIFGLGILGMTMSTITLHMLVSGFAVCEMFGIEPGGWRYKLSCLIPAPAFLGVILWKYMGTWIALPTSAVCILMLPIAYIGWFMLNNSSRYLGEDKPRGKKAVYWNIAMLFALAVTCTSVCYMLCNMWGPLVALFGKLF